jgi:hypothetical protein
VQPLPWRAALLLMVATNYLVPEFLKISWKILEIIRNNVFGDTNN